jgi:threonine dehydrogenase-like Zn-dependent dehydrogenase
MKTIAIMREHQLAINDIEQPQIGPRELLIKVWNIAICGSDIHLYEGTYGGPKHYPMIFGHEWSGEVVAIGSAVSGVSVGSRVTGDCSKFCGECHNCKVDKNLCEHIEKFGITVDGASSEYIVRDEKYVYPFEDSLDYACAALAEPLAVSANLLKRLQRQANRLDTKKVLVIGMGGIGLGILLQLKHVYGCESVFVSDISETRTSLARKFGGTVMSLVTNEAIDSYGNMYRHDGYDVVIDTTGNPAVMQLIFNLANPFGIIGCLGMLPSVDIPQKLIVLKALTVIGSIGGTGSFKEVLEFMQQHQKQVREIISHTFLVKDIKSLEQAFATAKDPKASVKVVLDITTL